MTASEPLIPMHGDYRKLKSFQIAQLAYDVTVRFCDRYIGCRTRTRDQMVQACPVRRAEHHRRQSGQRHFEEDGVKINKCNSLHPGRIALGF